jgi:hypothetical protein
MNVQELLRVPAIVLLAAAASCTSTGEPEEAAVDDGPPDWIDTLPVDDGFIYQHGFYIGSLYPEDNLKNALEAGRAQIAQSLKIRVESTRVVRTHNDTQTFRGQERITADSEIRNIEHVATWTDHHGLRGPPGQVWVLLRAPKV